MITDRIEPGDTIIWIAAGKVARIEGMAGKAVRGVVTYVGNPTITEDPDQDIHVMADYRTLPTAKFHGMGSAVPRNRIYKLIKGESKSL
jgi:hypothetical protein